jgi:hypothetical protein
MAQAQPWQQTIAGPLKARDVHETARLACWKLRLLRAEQNFDVHLDTLLVE